MPGKFGGFQLTSTAVGDILFSVTSSGAGGTSRKEGNNKIYPMKNNVAFLELLNP